MDHDGFTAWIDDRAADHLFSGVALAWRDGRPVVEHAAGTAHRGHGVPVRVDTRFAVASMTKLVTAIATLRLVAGGEVDLHRPIVDVLPPAARPAALTRDHTLHHLLSHTSGLGDYHHTEEPGFASFVSCWDRIPTYHLRGPGDMVPLFRDVPPNEPPGTRFRYTDANFVLVGLVVEAATGEPFADVARREVFVPAGLRTTEFVQLDDDPPSMAVGYLCSDDEPYDRWRSNVYSVPAGTMPDGGMVTTAADMAILVDRLEGGDLLPDELHRAMTSPQGPPRHDLEQYGYGCELTVVDGEVTMIGHGGSDPGVSCLLTHYRRDETTTVVLCNHDRGSWAVVQRLAAELGLDDPRE